MIQINPNYWLQYSNNLLKKNTNWKKILKNLIDYNTKITNIEDKIPDVNDLATKTALTTVENEIPDVSNLV